MEKKATTFPFYHYLPLVSKFIFVASFLGHTQTCWGNGKYC